MMNLWKPLSPPLLLLSLLSIFPARSAEAIDPRDQGTRESEQKPQIDDVPSFSCIAVFPEKDAVLSWNAETKELRVRGLVDADYKALFLKLNSSESQSPGLGEPLYLNVGADQFRTKTPTFTPMGSIKLWSSDLRATDTLTSSKPWQATLHLKLNETTLMERPKDAREKTMKEMDEFSAWLNSADEKAAPPKGPRYVVSKFMWIMECEYSGVDLPDIEKK